MKTRKQKNLLLVELAVFSAIIILMAFTPLGYLQIGVVKMTLIMIPVAVGAITIGPAAGAFLGLVFGVTSFAQCFGLDAFGTALMAINPIYTFIMCIVPRALMGYLCGLIFKAVKKLNKSAAYIAASVSGAVLNTVFFVGLLMLFFGRSDYIEGLRGTAGLWTFLAAFVGLNGLIEIVVCSIVGAPAAAAIDTAVKKLSRQ